MDQAPEGLQNLTEPRQVAEWLPREALFAGGSQGRTLGEPRAWPLPSASSETAMGNETDSCRSMRRPRPPSVQEAVTAVIVPRAHSIAATRSKLSYANTCMAFTRWQGGTELYLFYVLIL